MEQSVAGGQPLGADLLKGVAAAPGAAAAPVARMGPRPTLPDHKPTGTDPETESGAARQALGRVADGFDAQAGVLEGEAAEVLGALAVMARDPELARRAGERAEEGEPAAWAVHAACEDYRDLLTAAGGYLAERASDLVDIRDRAVALLLDEPMPGLPDPGVDHVLVADDLAPADTVRLDTGRVRALVTHHGGATSHTAILARALGIPAVVGCPGAADLRDGVVVAVDGDAGTVTVAPEPSWIEEIARRAAARRSALAEQSGPGRTSDGAAVALLLNLGEGDSVAAARHDSEGVGLLRTEFLFLGRAEPPSVAEQTEVYRRVFEAFGGRTVTVRTLDAGSDKPLAFVDTGREDNPALGVRGYRTARLFPELLTDQVVAIATAARRTAARVRVMAPMISTPAEMVEFAHLARGEGLPEVGAMIEVPGAALLADRIMQHADFVSIGTNDLAQYTMAADRTRGFPPELLDPWQAAVLELVGVVGRAGEHNGRPVGVCGETAANPLLALVLVGLGVTSLSMAPVALPAVRYALARHTLDQCRRLAELTLAADGPEQARQVLRAAVAPEVAAL